MALLKDGKSIIKCEVIRKTVYGKEIYYPKNELALMLCALLGQQTFSDKNLSTIAEVFAIVKCWE